MIVCVWMICKYYCRLMLRVFFSVLGIVVTTEGHISNTKVLLNHVISTTLYTCTTALDQQ